MIGHYSKSWTNIRNVSFQGNLERHTSIDQLSKRLRKICRYQETGYQFFISLKKYNTSAAALCRLSKVYFDDFSAYQLSELPTEICKLKFGLVISVYGNGVNLPKIKS